MDDTLMLTAEIFGITVTSLWHPRKICAAVVVEQQRYDAKAAVRSSVFPKHLSNWNRKTTLE
jgi:hypothetical protein